MVKMIQRLSIFSKRKTYPFPESTSTSGISYNLFYSCFKVKSDLVADFANIKMHVVLKIQANILKMSILNFFPKCFRYPLMEVNNEKETDCMEKN